MLNKVPYLIISIIILLSVWGYFQAERINEAWSHCYYVIQGQERNYISERYPYRLKHSKFSEIYSLDGSVYADDVSAIFTICDKGLEKVIK